MRRPFVLLGALALGSGAAMDFMLGQLRSDFFRAYLPPWVFASYATMTVGGVLVLAGLVTKSVEPKPMTLDTAAGLMARLALANTVAAACLLAPVLAPSLRLPILITQWPGIYMVLAYFSFLTVGVLGMAAWSVFIPHLPRLLGRESIGSLGVFVHVVLAEVGIFGLAISMFMGGYVGSWLTYTGAGPVVVGAQMEFSVIPSAVSIYLVAAGTVIGVANVLMSGRSVRV